MKLHEITQAISKDPHAKIKKWLDEQYIRNYTIRLDGVVDVDGDVWLRYVNERTLPVQFGKVRGGFFYNGAPITSLKGAPYVSGGFNCRGTKIKSLSSIDKRIKQVNGWFWCDKETTHILGTLLIDGITRFNIDGLKGPLTQIMNKYVGTGDILSAQDELIDAGFIDQARL